MKHRYIKSENVFRQIYIERGKGRRFREKERFRDIERFKVRERPFLVHLEFVVPQEISQCY